MSAARHCCATELDVVCVTVPRCVVAFTSVCRCIPGSFVGKNNQDGEQEGVSRYQPSTVYQPSAIY